MLRYERNLLSWVIKYIKFIELSDRGGRLHYQITFSNSRLRYPCP